MTTPLVSRVANPSLARRIGRPRPLAAFAWLYFAWSLVPALIAIGFSFNSGRSRSVWQGFSLQWWSGASGLLHNSVYVSALEQSFKLAVLNTLIAVPLGVGVAIALARWFGRGSGTLGLLATLPLVVPELVLAVALFVLLTHLLTFVHFGTLTELIGQVTFSLPFVVVITRGRLASIATDLEEAAMDLGATPAATLRLILIPLLEPAIVASAIIAFALSIDDFVATQYLSSTESTQTVPMLIYNSARGSASPALNAAAAVLMTGTMLIAGLGVLGYFAIARRRGLRATSAV